jgi:uncharacterized membrane protein
MIEVTSSVDLQRPSAEVFAFVADAGNNPLWQQGMRSCRWTTDPPIRIGSSYVQRASFLGKSVDSTFEVIDLRPGHSITIRTTESTFPIQVTRAVEELDPEHCRVTAIVRGDPSGMFRIATPMLRAMVQRSVRADYRRLRELLTLSGR